MSERHVSEHHGEFDPHAGFQQGENIRFNVGWYDDLRASKPNWTKVSSTRVHPNRGVAVYADAGQVIKFIQPDGPNIIDVWWFAKDIKDTSGEKYDPVYTTGLEGLICWKNSRIWSTVPHFRPMTTYIDDNIDPALMVDEETWPVWHGGHCSPELIEAAYGKQNHASCHTNAVEALMSVGFDFAQADTLAALHNICIFQPMSIKNSQFATGNVSQTWHATPFYGPPGTFVEYYAEIDLLVPVSHCPYGNQETTPYEADQYPIDIEVWDTGIEPQPSPRWHDWRPAFQAKIERLKAAGNTGPTARTFDED
jgi:uncharacterized protein YcgI (DUF1989 family)